MGHRDRRVCSRDAALGQPLATRPESGAQAEREHDDGPQTARTACAGLPRAELLVRRNQRARARVILSCGKRDDAADSDAAPCSKCTPGCSQWHTRQTGTARPILTSPEPLSPSLGGYAPIYGHMAQTPGDIYVSLIPRSRWARLVVKYNMHEIMGPEHQAIFETCSLRE